LVTDAKSYVAEVAGGFPLHSSFRDRDRRRIARVPVVGGAPETVTTVSFPLGVDVDGSDVYIGAAPVFTARIG
jgi:hypothetical protein